MFTRTVASVKKDETIGVRIPSELRSALEREQQRMSRKAGAEVKLSAVIRSILEQALLKRVKAA